MHALLPGADEIYKRLEKEHNKRHCIYFRPTERHHAHEKSKPQLFML